MLKKFCAGVLLILSFSPFTAPFSTCELRALLGQAGIGYAVPMHAFSRAAGPLDDVGVSPVPSSSRLDRPARVKLFKMPMVVTDHSPGAPYRARDISRALSNGDLFISLASSWGLTTILRL